MFREGTVLPVAGVTFYQENVAKSQPGDLVSLRHEADNDHDPNAVVVEDAAGRTLGYLPAILAGRMTDPAKGGVAGATATAVVCEVTSHTPQDGGDPTLGLRLNYRH